MALIDRSHTVAIGICLPLQLPLFSLLVLFVFPNYCIYYGKIKLCSISYRFHILSI